MKILFINPHSLSLESHARELELIQNHICNGDIIYCLICKMDMPACANNFSHNIRNCLRCIGLNKKKICYFRKNTINLLKFKKIALPHNILSHIRTLSDTDDYKKYKYKYLNIGYESLSTLMTIRRDPMVYINPENKNILYNLIIASVKMNIFLENIFEDYEFDIVYLPNGRMTPTRTIFETCNHYGIQNYIYEAGCNLQHYELYDSYHPHKFGSEEKRILKFWKNSQENNKIKMQKGSDFFMNKINNREDSLSFVKKQAHGKMPYNFNRLKTNIVFFTTSDDEYASISEEWDWRIYPNQPAGIAKILKSLKLLKQDRTDFHIYIRMHPNLQGINNKESDYIRNLTHPFLTVIQPESDIDTYQLLKEATCILTFGSTVGVEAVFWGKPSILLSHSIYYNLGCTYNPQSHEEVINYILNIPKPKNKINAIKYGYYRSQHGKKFKHVIINSPYDIFFIGKNIKKISLPYYFLIQAINLSEKLFGQNFMMKIRDLILKT